MLARSRLTGSFRLALAFAVLMLGTQLWPGLSDLWRFSRSAFEGGSWWQLLTSQWVHLSGGHVAVNVACMALMLFAFDQLVDKCVQIAALLGGYMGVAIVIAMDPDCGSYAGASGALHGFLAGNAMSLLMGGPSQPATRNNHSSANREWLSVRGLAWVVLLVLIVKLVVQHDPGSRSIPGWLGFPAYYPAHEAGAVSGLLAAVIVSMLHRGSPTNGQSS